MNEYFEFGLAQQETILSLTDFSKNEFIPWWADKVNIRFGLDYDELIAIYDRPNDLHNTEDKTRAIWKYGAAKGVSGTPVAFINGVKLDVFPTSKDDWLTTLRAVKNS